MVLLRSPSFVLEHDILRRLFRLVRTDVAFQTTAEVETAYQAVLAQPPGSVQGVLRITEQGEMVAAKYSRRAPARRNVETLVAATLEASCLDAERLGDDAERFTAAMSELADIAHRAYRDLVYGHPRFVEFFRAITPIGEIATLERENSRMRFHNIVTTAKLIAAGAYLREESRGGHFRSDFPEQRANWKHRTFITLAEADKVVAELSQAAAA